jgi:hypothetical protein
MPASATVIEFPRFISEAPRCAQCKTQMALCSVEPHPREAEKELHLYTCRTCGLPDRIESPKG